MDYDQHAATSSPVCRLFALKIISRCWRLTLTCRPLQRKVLALSLASTPSTTQTSDIINGAAPPSDTFTHTTERIFPSEHDALVGQLLMSRAGDDDGFGDGTKPDDSDEVNGTDDEDTEIPPLQNVSHPAPRFPHWTPEEGS